MRILQACYIFPPEPCTTGVIVKELAEDLTAAGHDETVVTGRSSSPAGVLFDGWKVRFRQVEHAKEGYRVIRRGYAVRQRKKLRRRLWYCLPLAVSSFANAMRSGKVNAVLDLSTPRFGRWTAWLFRAAARVGDAFRVLGRHGVQLATRRSYMSLSDG